MRDYETIFKQISTNKNLLSMFLEILDEEISMPNIKMPTLGGHCWWQTLIEYNGLKLQQNYLTRHARILDSSNCRIAWGTINGMEKALDRMIRLIKKYPNGYVY